MKTVFESSRKWRETFDSVSEAVWLNDAGGRILLCNSAAELLLNRHAGEIIGHRCCEVVKAATKDLLSYSLRNDIIFKYVFGHENNEKILRALLNAILGLEGDERIESLSFLNPANLQEYLKDKFTTLDVKAKDSTGKKYNIEMQV